MNQRYLWAFVALNLAASSMVTASPLAYRSEVLPVDSVLRVRMNDTIGSDRDLPGDRFTATVEDPAFPKGTVVRGVVIAATPADRTMHGRLAVDFRTLELPNGREIPIAGTPTALDTNSVRTTANGRLVANSHDRTNTGKYIGYGAGGGLLIGSVLGKNVVGGILGAGVGYLLGKHHEKRAEYRNVVLKQGTELGVRLDQTVALAGW